MPKKIVLFTPLPPSVGDGNQSLRTLIPHLRGIELTWTYLHHRTVDFQNSLCVGTSITNGPLFSSILTMMSICRGESVQLRPVVEKLLGMNADRYWVIASREGLAVADMLIKAGQSVHLSIQEDPPSALLERSPKYWPLKALGEKQLARLLKRADSVDVASEAIKERYLSLYGIRTTHFYPYIEKLPKVPPLKNDAVARIGLAGMLYSKHEAQIFARALKLAERHLVKPIEWHFWGIGAYHRQWLEKLKITTFFHPAESEERLVYSLAGMDGLYLMYPFDKKNETFRRTSYPAKLPIYLKAQRPIIAHMPTPAQAAEFVMDTNVGLVVPTLEPEEIARHIALLLFNPPLAGNYQVAKERWHGRENLERINQALLGPNG